MAQLTLRPSPRLYRCLAGFACVLVTTSLAGAAAPGSTGDAAVVADEHASIGVTSIKSATHTAHPDAQWYPDAGLGLFIHWGISSVKAMNISWPMIPGRPLAKERIADAAERERIVREEDWNLNGRKPEITPNQYWEMAKSFNPTNYNPDLWMNAAREAGFTYAVLTARHHEGFALWPSAYGELNTRTYAQGQDLIKPYVDACRKHGIKVGLYYSPPDWYFDREYMNFLYGRVKNINPEFPSLDANLKPRTAAKSKEQIARHQAEYAAMVNGQVEELLTKYGKIDVLWFDGKPNAGTNKVISQERIRQLQPGIVINPRLHGKGDFVTFERTLSAEKPVEGWAEFCNTWTTCWAHMNIPYRAPGFVLGQLAQSRSLGVNYLLGVGPMASGEFCDDIYTNMRMVGQWMKINSAAVKNVQPLPAGEKASVPATSAGNLRYLFAVPEFKDGGAYTKDQLPPRDLTITLAGVAQPKSVTLMGTTAPLKFTFSGNTLSVNLPASSRSTNVDVIRVDLPETRAAQSEAPASL